MNQFHLRFHAHVLVLAFGQRGQLDGPRRSITGTSSRLMIGATARSVPGGAGAFGPQPCGEEKGNLSTRPPQPCVDLLQRVYQMGQALVLLAFDNSRRLT